MSGAANRGRDPTVADAEERVSSVSMCWPIGSAGTKSLPGAFESKRPMNTKSSAAPPAIPHDCVLSLRTRGRNPNHHLWWNHGSWWLHATVHRPDYTKQRLRVPLGTKDIHHARTRRNALLQAQGSLPQAFRREAA
jgi:hypothetical protein